MARQIRISLTLLVFIFLIGTVGYKLIGGSAYTLLDSFYMTMITLTTVGFREIIPVKTPAAELFTILLIFGGFGVLLYTLSSITAFFVEGKLAHIFWRKRMTKDIAKMKDHIIVCGAGESGQHVIQELLSIGRRFVVIERDAQRITRILMGGGSFPFVVGDATDDDLLQQAGIHEAEGLISALSSDTDNLYVTLSARQMNPKLRIIARSIDPKANNKMLNAGADSVINPSRIGALRMISEMVRPSVVSFLESMMKDPSASIRLEELHIEEDSAFLGKKLTELRFREQAGVSVIAIKNKESGSYTYNPPADTVLDENMTLIVLGDIQKLKGLERDETAPNQERI